MKSELKPCPWCGNENVNDVLHDMVYCGKCARGVEGTSGDREDAIEAWNMLIRHNDEQRENPVRVSFVGPTLPFRDGFRRISIGETNEGLTTIRYEELDSVKGVWVAKGEISWPTHDMGKIGQLLIAHEKMCEVEALGKK